MDDPVQYTIPLPEMGDLPPIFIPPIKIHLIPIDLPPITFGSPPPVPPLINIPPSKGA